MSKNDERILGLRKQIEEKKKSLVKVSGFTPLTNCSIELDGVRHNIQVLNKDQLIHLLVKLTSYSNTFLELEIDDKYIISGYEITEWMDDIASKLSVIKHKEEENKLKVMEAKLSKMLSDEKKTELEIDVIENMLK